MAKPVCHIDCYGGVGKPFGFIDHQLQKTIHVLRVDSRRYVGTMHAGDARHRCFEFSQRRRFGLFGTQRDDHFGPLVR
jgi:hypothetical protein